MYRFDIRNLFQLTAFWIHNIGVASFLQLFGRKLNLAGLQAITGINRKQLNHYVTGHSKPSPATVRKIEQGIKSFQEELSRVAFV